ncbi:MAG TPA: DmsC/YnfH family molybdoenzyme membrane anchor subunit [Bacteroidales bacterium]|nr:DmsC/YnfH family molybdoenzyme membrane anchor subunit [Bacteroidales bacterium]
MQGSEWSLIAFTLLTQISVGGFIILSVFNRRYLSKVREEDVKPAKVKALVLLTGLALLALIVSFLHLGNPINAIYALNNLPSSWLSREILFVSLFVAAMVVLTFSYIRSIGPVWLYNVLSLVAVVSGILGVFSMSKVYMLETIPVWNSITTPIQFFLSAFLLGGLVVLLAGVLNPGYRKPDLKVPDYTKAIVEALIIMLILLLASLILWIVNVYLLSGGGLAEEKSLFILMSENSLFFYLRIVLMAVSILLIIYRLFSRSFLRMKSFLVILFILVLMAEVMGRYLFYVSYIRIGI